jgi:hypothetical protein
VSARGVHRGIYCVLVDGPDFQALAPVTRHVFLTARLSPQAGPACIFRYYPEVLPVQTGWPRRKVERALRELIETGWAQLEDGILWLINGLRYDPTIRLSNPKHRAAVLRAIKGLPHRPIVARFCQYYNLQWLSDSHSIAIPELGSPKTETTRNNPKTETTREERPATTAEPSTAPAAASPPTPPATAFRVNDEIQAALRQAPRLGAVSRLWSVEFWRAEVRANGAADMPAEILKAEAWMAANPRKAPRTDLPRFLHNWLSRADRDAEED